MYSFKLAKVDKILIQFSLYFKICNCIYIGLLWLYLLADSYK